MHILKIKLHIKKLGNRIAVHKNNQGRHLVKTRAQWFCSAYLDLSIFNISVSNALVFIKQIPVWVIYTYKNNLLENFSVVTIFYFLMYLVALFSCSLLIKDKFLRGYFHVTIGHYAILLNYVVQHKFYMLLESGELYHSSS